MAEASRGEPDSVSRGGTGSRLDAQGHTRRIGFLCPFVLGPHAIEGPRDADAPATRFVRRDDPVRDHGRTLVDALEPALALPDGLDRMAPQAAGDVPS